MIDLFSEFPATPMRERLIVAIGHQKETGEQELFKDVATEFAYQILHEPKYYVTHRYDPPWDCSGETCRDERGYDIGNYETLGDYLEEYSGNSEASFVSGCGLFHETRRDDFEKILDKHTALWVKEAIKDIISSEDKNKFLEFLFEQKDTDIDDSEILSAQNDNELVDAIFNGLYWECNIDLISEQMDRLEKFNTRFLYGKGEKIAQEQRALEIKIEKEKAQQEEIERQQANTIWEKVKKLYKLQKQKQIPVKIEMDTYGDFREFLDNNQISKEERVLIANYYSYHFSNNACYKLRGVIT